MKPARLSDKSVVVDLLCNSFDQNLSINFVCKQDHNRKRRIRLLMSYVFTYCMANGNVYLSDNNLACLLCKESNKPLALKHVFSFLFWQVKLALQVIGLFRIGKVMKRESALKKHYPKGPFVHLWFVAVHTEHQNKGLGSTLIRQWHEGLPTKAKIVLETSVLSNLSFYNKLGYSILQEIELDYRLYVMVRENTESKNIKSQIHKTNTPNESDFEKG